MKLERFHIDLHLRIKFFLKKENIEKNYAVSLTKAHIVAKPVIPKIVLLEP